MMARRNILLFALSFTIILLVGIKISYSVEGTPTAPEDVKEGTGWLTKDFEPYIKAIEELEKLSKDYSENLLKLAKDEYATGLDIVIDMENEITGMKKGNKDKTHLNEQFYWQEIDRKNAELRQIRLMKIQAKLKAVTYFTRAIDYLDKIQNAGVKNDPKFINFQTRLFQVYVSTQYDLQNFRPCIAILERFITLGDKQSKDPWAYKYMASCYGYLEKVLLKYQPNAEEQIQEYKIKKNRSLLTAVEILYEKEGGKDSPQFKKMQELVEQDEKKSELINDF